MFLTRHSRFNSRWFFRKGRSSALRGRKET